MSEQSHQAGTGPAGGTKRVGSGELFFDLVFVVAVTQVSTLLQHDHGWAGLLRALVVFVPVYWTWVGAAVLTNQRDASRPGLRITLFAVALAAVFMALALPQAYGERGLLFALSYWTGRVLLGSGLLRRAARTRRLPANPYTVAMFVTGPLLVVGALTEGTVRELIWACAAVGDLSSSTVLRSRLASMHMDPEHLAERFGLFVLIALGESVVAIGASAQSAGQLSVGVGAAVAAAFVLACGLWWTYFHFAADAFVHSLSTAKVQGDITRFVLSYGHLAFIAAIIVVAVGMHDAIAHPGEHLPWGVAGLLFGGSALYLATFGFTRWAMFRQVSTTRLSAAGVVVAVLPVAGYVPALVSLVVLAVVVAAVNVVELMLVRRRSRSMSAT